MRRFLPSHSALIAFDAAVRYLSFTKAAEELSITQSAVSRQVLNLEDFLGIRLFERVGPKIVLTDLGQRYHDQISALLDEIEAASIEAVRGRSTMFFLKLAMPPTLQRRWGVELLCGFSAAHPDCLYELKTCANDVDAEHFEADFLVLRGNGHWPNCRVREILKETLVVVGPPSLVPVDRYLTEEEFGQVTLLQNMSRPSLWMKWQQSSNVFRQGPIAGPRFDSTDSLISATEAGLGLAVVPHVLVQKELSSGRLRRAFEHEAISDQSLFLCCPEARGNSPAATTFRKWIHSHVRRLGGDI